MNRLHINDNYLGSIVRLLLALLLGLTAVHSFAEDGYEVWLRYRPVDDAVLLKEYRAVAEELVIPGDSPLLGSATAELRRGLTGLLGRDMPAPVGRVTRDGAVVLGTTQSLQTAGISFAPPGSAALGREGYLIRSVSISGHRATLILGGGDQGALYGAFHLLRLIQTRVSLHNLNILESPVNPLRMINHWDNLDGTIERGYAGSSIFHWDTLPRIEARYTDYARMLASLDINGCVVNNVNTSTNHEAGWRLLTPPWLPKVAALADVFRPYGVRLYLSVNFHSPVLIGGLATADPRDPAVKRWWADKADEIYKAIPDFGGFLVKADSEGEPGPYQYGCNHADGANLLAAALKPHGGLVMWRAFVYDPAADQDRAKSAFADFRPLDGQFASNAIVQCKNGPIDFQVREPVAPLFGKMPNTNMMLELQITQEYTGHGIGLCYLVPQWKEYLQFDTYAQGSGSTLRKIASGTLFRHAKAGIAGVANVGDDRDWTGSNLAQANMYGFGRLAWNPSQSTAAITSDWVKMTFGNNPQVVSTISGILLQSWNAYENYTSPLGVGFMCKGDNHYDPDPAARAEYHHADKLGVGYDRTQTTGDGFAGQYQTPVAQKFESLATCPEAYLLFFHHLPYNYRLKSGQTLIQYIYDAHYEGVEQVQSFITQWKSLEGKIDDNRFHDVLDRLNKQTLHAKKWRDTINSYFYDLSGIPDSKGRFDSSSIAVKTPQEEQFVAGKGSGDERLKPDF